MPLKRKTTMKLGCEYAHVDVAKLMCVDLVKIHVVSMSLWPAIFWTLDRNGGLTTEPIAFAFIWPSGCSRSRARCSVFETGRAAKPWNESQ